jgi:hypothetical protein
MASMSRASMSERALVFVHSPLVGPLTWRAVAERCAGVSWTTAVADLTSALVGPPPYQPAIAAAVGRAADPLDRPVVLIGHSGAGPLLPGVAASIGAPVAGLVYADAGLPHPGRTWFETAPAELAEHLHDLSTDGRLPPWHEWFQPEVLATVLPDPGLRAAFTDDLAPLPLDFFQEPTSPATWSGPAGYLLLSEGYRGDATVAASDGLPVVERPSHHLAMLTDPDEVAAKLQELLAAVFGGP